MTTFSQIPRVPSYEGIPPRLIAISMDRSVPPTERIMRLTAEAHRYACDFPEVALWCNREVAVLRYCHGIPS